MKIKVFIHAQWDEYNKKYNFHPWGYDMSESSDCGPLVEKLEVEFNPPPNEVLVNGTIATYRKQQQNIRAAAEMECNSLQQKIDDLLCIENKSEPA